MWQDSAWKVLAVTACSLLLHACATPEPPIYGPIQGETLFGYRDLANPDGGKTVLVVLPPHASLSMAREFWDRRAAELCPGGVAKTIVFRSDRKEVMAPAPYVQYSAGFSSRVPIGFEIEGYVYCRGTSPPAGEIG